MTQTRNPSLTPAKPSQLESLTDAENQVTSYTYNDAGNKLTEVYPDHVPSSTIGQAGFGIVSFTPDATGRTVQRTDQQGDTCDFTYDLAGRLSSKAYTGHTSGPLSGQSHTDTFTYDDAGRMLTAVSGRYGNTVTHTYDDAGRKDDESLQIGGQTYTTQTDYDAVGQVSKLIYPDGKEIDRSYTARGQLAGIDFDATTIDTRTYDDGGRMLTSAYNNGVSETRAYNNDNTLASINFTGAPIAGPRRFAWGQARVSGFVIDSNPKPEPDPGEAFPSQGIAFDISAQHKKMFIALKQESSCTGLGTDARSRLGGNERDAEPCGSSSPNTSADSSHQPRAVKPPCASG